MIVEMDTVIRHYIHTFLTAVIVLGGIISGFIFKNVFLLKAHVILCGNIILHWLTNNNRCIISEQDYEHKNEYTLGLLKNIGIHIDPTNDIIGNIISYGTTSTLLFISWLKLVSLTHTIELPSTLDLAQSVV